MSAICKNCKAVKENKEDYCAVCGYKEMSEEPSESAVERWTRNIFCSNCGEKIDVKNNFCSNCGVFFKKTLPKLSENYLNGDTDFDIEQNKPKETDLGAQETVMEETRERDGSARRNESVQSERGQAERESPMPQALETPYEPSVMMPPQAEPAPPVDIAIVSPPQTGDVPITAAAPTAAAPSCDKPFAADSSEKHGKLKDKICKFGFKFSVLMLFTILLPLFKGASGEIVLGVESLEFTLGYVYLISTLLLAFCGVISMFHTIKRESNFLRYCSLLSSFTSVGLLIGFGYGKNLMYGYYIGLAAATYFLATQSLYFIMTVKKKPK
jgi:RNA polymerase subunit RPABC4/transcription elongation factor Spt4